MHIKLDRLQKNDRLIVDSMARDTAQTKRAVDRVVNLVHAAADEIERSRRLPDAVVAALRDTGINRLLMPTALGGMEAPITDVMDVMERIAAVDGSTGWCAAIGAGSNLFAGYMPATGAGTVFADPDQGNATMFAPVGRMVSDHGRATLSGRWPFTSNCLHSAWVGLGALFHEADGIDPIPRIVFVPVADLTIEDTWDVVGLRGTGSHHVAAAEIPVDLDRSVFALSTGRGPTARYGGCPSIRRCCRPSSPFRSASLGAPSTRFHGRRAKAAPRGAASWPTRRSRWPSWPSQTRGCGRPAPDCATQSARRTCTPNAESRSAVACRLASTWPACMPATPASR